MIHCMFVNDAALLQAVVNDCFTKVVSGLQTVRRLAPLLAFYSIMNGSGFLLSGALK